MKSIFGFGAAGLGNLDLSVLGLGSTIAATALVTTLSQPAWAAATRITGVEVNDTDSGIELLLMQARSGDRPQVFSVERGNSWVADIINSELALPSGGSFQSMNPAPGIASVQVVPLDANSVRVIVTGESGAPAGELTTRSAQGLAFNFDASGGGSAAAPRSSTAPAAASTTVAQGSGANPDVLVPNPEITITGGQPTAIPRANPAPPFLPRAVAPPLGDIAVSELAPTVPSIDLGTVERVPRLVLRDAPAREVLALLARAAGLNLAFIGGEAGGEGAVGGEGPAVTLDIEGEPVQDVFNYVLRLTNLRAVRQGRTILVGTELPDAVQTRNTIVRTLRVNQADASAVANFLVAQGAEARLVETVTTRTIDNEGTINQSVREEQTTQVTSIAPEESTNGAPSVLRGLTVVTDSRLNSITLVGEPSTVDLATSFSKQLDLRQRQVAINVKIVDINLDNTSSFSSDFSVGIGDAFVVSDGGAAAINFGEFSPASAPGSIVSRPIIANPFAGTPTVVDLSNVVTLPTLTTPGRSTTTGTSTTTTSGASGPGLSTTINEFASTIANGITNSTSSGETASTSSGGTTATSQTFTTPSELAETITRRFTDLLGLTPNTSTQTFTNTLTQQIQAALTTINSTNSSSSNSTNSSSSNGTTGSSTITGPNVSIINTASGGSQTLTTSQLTNAITGAVTSGGQEILGRIASLSSSPLAAQIVDTAGNFALPALFQYPSRFLASVQASVVNQNAKILTDPTLVVQETQTAAVNLTEKVLTEVQETVTTENSVAQVSREYTYEDVGLLLSISVDRIDDNGFVTLELQPRVSTVVGAQSVQLSNGQVQQLNVVGKRELSSGKVRIRNGQTLILAGIIQETERESVTKWPILGDLPILGSLFRGSATESARSEVVIVVTPQIMDDSDRSSYGYNYTPGPDAQDLIDRPR